MNRELTHCGGDQWWTGPPFAGAIVPVQLVAELVTPIPWLPEPITHVVQYHYADGVRDGFWAHLLMGTLFPSTAGTFFTTNPFPYGLDVLPDHS